MYCSPYPAQRFVRVLTAICDCVARGSRQRGEWPRSAVSDLSDVQILDFLTASSPLATVNYVQLGRRCGRDANILIFEAEFLMAIELNSWSDRATEHKDAVSARRCLAMLTVRLVCLKCGRIESRKSVRDAESYEAADLIDGAFVAFHVASACSETRRAVTVAVCKHCETRAMIKLAHSDLSRPPSL